MFLPGFLEELERYCRRVLKTRVELALIKSSPWALVYRLRSEKGDMILKTGLEYGEHSGVGNEIKALLFLNKHGISDIPPVIHNGRFRGHDVLITNFLKNAGKIHAASLARIFGKIHAITRTDTKGGKIYFAGEILKTIASTLPHLRASHCPQDLILDLERISVVLSRYRTGNPRSFHDNKRLSFINMDNNDNVLVCGNRIFICDWHLSRFGDNAWDLARLLSFYKIPPGSFLPVYEKYTGRDTGLTQRISFYETLNDVLSVLLFLTNSGTFRGNPFRVLVAQEKESEALMSVYYSVARKKIRALRQSMLRGTSA